MAQPRDDGQKELFRPALDQIIDMGHPLVRLAQQIDWGFLDRQLGGIYKPGAGQGPPPASPPARAEGVRAPRARG